MDLNSLFDLGRERGSFAERAKRRAELLADHLLDESGKIVGLEKILSSLKKEGPIILDGAYNDVEIHEHQIRVLKRLLEDGEMRMKIESFGLPLSTPFLEEELGVHPPLKDRHVVWGVLTALLSVLRQTIGSCFATAPAIMIHEEMPHLFLEDIQSLLVSGQLTRVIRGAEYTVPVSPSGHSLLKTWEYTVASFVDVKTEFSRWNLFASLGLHHEEEGGIGQVVYDLIQRKLIEVNERGEKHEREVEIASDQARVAERLLKNASTYDEARRLKADYQGKAYHLKSVEEARDKAVHATHHLAHFYTHFIQKCIDRFQEFFQEVYDPQMVKGSDYDDSPAGFRLLFKHGRRHVRSWTWIHSSDEFVQALVDFFLAVEHPIRDETQWEEGKTLVSELVSAVANHVRGDVFLDSAMKRMGEKTPWAYLSGGTVPTLLKTYFHREGELSEEGRWVESAQDLLIFFLDALKTLSPKESAPFLKNPGKRMLALSPTHAFSLLPGQPLFRQGWEDPGFTYTWVRDHILEPRSAFYADVPDGIPEDELLSTLPLSTAKQVAPLFALLGIAPLDLPAVVGRKQLHDLIIEKTDLSHEEVERAMRRCGLSPPEPLIIGDTNWDKTYFAILAHPRTGELDLWRTDRLGLTGKPMREWAPYLNGASDHPWTLFLRASEYSR